MADNIELRSEHVRKIIGHRLPKFIGAGITMITLLIALLLLAAFLVPLPDTSGNRHPENAGKTFYERMIHP